MLLQVLSNLTRLHSEPVIASNTVNLLVALVETKEKCQRVVSSPGLGQLLHLAVSKERGRLPSSF